MSRLTISRFAYGAAMLVAALTTAGCGGGGPSTDNQVLDNHVHVASGDIVGNPADAAGIISFKGIPYAAPPVGKLRWKEPQPVQQESSERQTVSLGPKCWAANPTGGPIVSAGTSEDCLYLNVWTGAKTRNAKLPVMVWVHGGGFQFGTGSDPATDGTSLAKKDVIIVTLNYRLGVLGFLSRPDLDAESGGHKSGMYGMLDIIAALSWVKTNIAAFGGDPGNVTVFGESAGAHAVGMLMASPLAAGKFDKALGESGAFWQSEMPSFADAQASGLALSVKLAAPTLDQLRAIPALDLENATLYNLTVATVYSPIVDGYVLPELPYLRFKNGRQIDVPLLAGWNAAEGLPFLAYSLPHDTPQAFIAAATAKFGAANIPRFLQLYPASTPDQAAQSAQVLVGDTTIRDETWAWAGLQQKTGRSPVYVYNFSFTSAYTPVASHLNEVAYVFGNFLPGPYHPPVAPSTQDLAMSSAMQTYWTNFARSGNPNGSGVPQWPQYTGPGSQVIQLGSVIQVGPEEGTERYQFLEQFRTPDGLLPVGHH